MAVPDRGIATFKDLGIRAEPSSQCYDVPKYDCSNEAPPSALLGQAQLCRAVVGQYNYPVLDPSIFVEAHDLDAPFWVTYDFRRCAKHAATHDKTKSTLTMAQIYNEIMTKSGDAAFEAMTAASAQAFLEALNKTMEIPSESTRFCSPDMIGLTITSPGNVGAEIHAVPETAVSISDCAPGTWLDRRRKKMSCTSCAVGKYSSTINAGQFPQADDETGNVLFFDPCKMCTPGRFQNEEGQIRCKICSIGRYSESLGLTQCDICDRGKSTRGGMGRRNCMNCPQGYHGGITGVKGGEFGQCGKGLSG